MARTNTHELDARMNFKIYGSMQINNRYSQAWLQSFHVYTVARLRTYDPETMEQHAAKQYMQLTSF